MLNKERRSHNRVETNLEAVVYKDGREYDATLSDISNVGCKLTLTADPDDFKSGDIIDLAAVDEYSLFSSERQKLLCEKLRVIRIHHNDSTLTLGCRFTEPDKGIAKYVSDKEVEDYLQKNSFRRFLKKNPRP